MAQPLLTDAELARIREAVDTAERATAGEIVPYVVARSGGYEVALWRGAALGALLAAAAALVAAELNDGWDLGWLYAAQGALLVVFAGGLAGMLVASLAPVRRMLAGAKRLDTHVARRAAQAFVEEQVFATRDRTGILLFVSLLEHRILVLGDAGINAKVAAEEWAEVVVLVREGIRRRALADGMAEAVTRCGELLHRRGVALREDDTDELPDDVRIRRE